MTYKYIMMSIVITAIFGCAQTQTDADGNPVPDLADQGIICVEVADMGSRLGKRVCTTRVEREAAAQITREEIRNKQRASQTSGGGPVPASPGN